MKLKNGWTFTYIEVKNNKVLFNLSDRFASLISNNVTHLMYHNNASIFSRLELKRTFMKDNVYLTFYSII